MLLAKELCFVCSKEEFSGVKKIADKVALDVQKVFGFEPEIKEVENLAEAGILEEKKNVLIFGTCSKSCLISQLEEQTLIQTRDIFDKNESYNFTVKDNFIFIAGSDKRGTIYGLFHLSELLGVSPLVDWNNILPQKKTSFELENQEYFSKEPSVKYRGFFINDEWPAFGNWANHNFGGVNAKLYEHVFELLLRLKGNYLWPAMWASRFSDDGPDIENARLADELGVIMGASHHEPCCRAGEEYKYLRGKNSIYGDAWNFRSNREGITKFWEDGLKRNGQFENVITVGMRGEADTAIMQNATLKDNIDLLRDVIKTQNQLIKKYVNEDLDKVPRMLALYKEVEPYFYGKGLTKGLMNDPSLDGVTLMLCDDNHGNLRTVPTARMRNHKGGYGMYYHFDYHGWPYSYEWINTSYLPKVKEQMCAAYEFGIRELWIVNMGDIMSNEFPLSYFLDLAYDYEKYSAVESTTQDYTKKWIDMQFACLSDEQKQMAYDIIDGYTKIANMRRTECLKPDTFHPVNFGEADQILQRAQHIMDMAEELKKQTKKMSNYTGIFGQIIYPALGTMNIVKMQILSGKNQWLASKNAVAADYYIPKIKECLAFDKALIDEVDKTADGKFYAMTWSEHFGFNSWCEAMNSYPTYVSVEPVRKNRIAAWVETNEKVTSGQDWTDRNLYSSAFKNPDVKEFNVCVADCCKEEVPFEITFNKVKELNWLSAQIVKTEIPGLRKIVVTVNRDKLAIDPEKLAVMTIKGTDGHGAKFEVYVNIDACVPSLTYPSGTFIQTDSFISIEADHFTSKSVPVVEEKQENDQGDSSHGILDKINVLNLKKKTDDGVFEILPGYGKTHGAVKAFPVISEYPKAKDAPYVEYQFAALKDDVCAFDFYLNPSNPAYKNNKIQFVMEVNGEKLLKDVVDSKTFAVGDNQVVWGTDITNNIRISTVYQNCKKGLNVLRFYPVTPNIVLEKIVIHSSQEKLPSSYLGPDESYRVK